MRRLRTAVKDTGAAEPQPRVGAVIVSHNPGADLGVCLDALEGQTTRLADIIVVDNASSDGTPQVAAERGVRCIANAENLGFARAANQGIAALETEIALVLNPDVRLESGAVSAVLDVFGSDLRIGIVGCLLRRRDGSIQHFGGRMRMPDCSPFHDDRIEMSSGAEALRDVEFVTGAAIAVRRAMVESIGGFDEAYFLYYEDADLCFRARQAGWRIVVSPRVRGTHDESTVANRDMPAKLGNHHEGRLRFMLRHRSQPEVIRDLPFAERGLAALAATDEERVILRAVWARWSERLQTDPGDRTESRREIARILHTLAEGEIPPPVSSVARPLTEPLKPGTLASRLPFAGALITFVRRRWNEVSTRWYVEPALRQQDEINRQVAGILRDLESRLLSLEHRERKNRSHEE